MSRESNSVTRRREAMMGRLRQFSRKKAKTTKKVVLRLE